MRKFIKFLYWTIYAPIMFVIAIFVVTGRNVFEGFYDLFEKLTDKIKDFVFYYPPSSKESYDNIMKFINNYLYVSDLNDKQLINLYNNCNNLMLEITEEQSKRQNDKNT